MSKEFGTTIKNARLTKDLSLRDLAELTGLDHSYIGRLEKDTSIPSRETVVKLAKALNIPEDELMVMAGYIENEELKEIIMDVLEKNKDERTLRGGEAVKKRYLETEPSPEQKIRAAISDDPELLQFWEELIQRDDLKMLMRQVRNLPPDGIKRIIRYIKMVEDEEAAEEI